jgi:histidinol phosphatase-like PHP family hydrolase
MIDLHTHTLLSDGGLLPSELVRRAWAKGYKAIALADHVDHSNIDFVLPRLVKVSRVLNKHWPIKVLPGVEITHSPLEEIKPLVKLARAQGAKIVIVHGETVTEPVINGTNRVAIEAKADIVSHPGLLTEEDAVLAKANGVYLEITTRAGHSKTNLHVRDIARATGAGLVLNTDSHDPPDIIDPNTAESFLRSLKFSDEEIKRIFENSAKLIK